MCIDRFANDRRVVGRVSREHIRIEVLFFSPELGDAGVNSILDDFNRLSDGEPRRWSPEIQVRLPPYVAQVAWPRSATESNDAPAVRRNEVNGTFTSLRRREYEGSGRWGASRD